MVGLPVPGHRKAERSGGGIRPRTVPRLTGSGYAFSPHSSMLYAGPALVGLLRTLT
jgi:hypothetical protein